MKFDNYEAMKKRMESEFIRFDQEAMIRKFRLRADDDNLYMRFFGTEYAVDRALGTVRSAAGEAGYNEAMTLYDVLCYSKPDCRAAGNFVNLSSLSSIQGGSMQSQGGGLFSKFPERFDGRCPELAAACEALGGVAEGKGDVAYRLPMFDFLPVMLQFWESDDEFPASLQLFADKNILDFMHYETVWFALSHLMLRLSTLMG